MNDTTDHSALLPDGISAAVEVETGARIIALCPRGGGGASREGAELDLEWPDGTSQRAYMNYDVHRAGAGDDAAFLREAAVIRSLSTAHWEAGVRVAPFIAAIPEMRALIGGFVAGEASFNKLNAADDRLAVATDFMDQLAKLHSIDAAVSPVEGMGPVGPVATLIAHRIDVLRTRNSGNDRDPLIQLSIDWLADNIPTNLPAPVIVHGDAGPANFLYADGKVTALLDWELCHYGDPMADLAMLCLRSLFQPFVPMPQAFAAYEAAGGQAVDLARVRYWRLLFQAGFARKARYDDPDAPPPPNLGMNMVYSTIHRRVLSEALAEAAGVALEPVAMPNAPEGARHRAFAIALDDIRNMIVPRLSDQQAAVKAKGLARLIKWWRDIERYEPAFLEAERCEIAAALGQEFARHADAWAALCRAIETQTLPRSTAIRLINTHVTREAALMADAMGGMANTRFAPLE
jgi:hypothetical protein